MGIIPQYKIGTCSQCGDVDVPCVKVKKDLFCKFKCHSLNKATEQQTKSNERNKIRGLIKYQHEEVGVDNVQELTIDLDRTISRFLRLRDMEADGKITCYTCDKRIPWQNAHASLFKPFGIHF